MVEFSRQLL